MLINLAAGGLVVFALAQDTDTTFAVDPALRLNVSNHSGEIFVRTWDRNEVRLRADNEWDDPIVIDRTGSEILIRSESWRRWANDFAADVERDRVRNRVRGMDELSSIDYELVVPASMSLDLSGPSTDVRVRGTRGEVTVRVNEGDVSVHGGSGRVSIRTIEGDVVVNEAEGTIHATTLDGDVHVRDSSGDVSVETADGDLILGNLSAASVEATSVDGDISYLGDVQPRGVYLFSTHDGDVTAAIPGDAGVRVTVATNDGEFTSDFPITIQRRTRARRFSFVLGTGSAQMELESFDGDIDLRRRNR